MARKGLRQRAIAGEQVLGSMVFEFFTPGIAQVMKLAGCEYLIYDMEHAGFSIESLKTQVAHCRGLGIAPMVRVPRGEYHFLARALDVGAQGVMVPMVDSVEQARAIAEATHYPPEGRRGAAFGFPHDDYEPGDPAAKMKSADARNFVIAQIETERGLAEVEEIAAVDGIDVLWVGHFDLSNFMGIPAQFDNPTFLQAMQRVADVAKKHGKAAGFMATDPAWVDRVKAMGYTMLAVGTDVSLLADATKRLVDHAAAKA